MATYKLKGRVALRIPHEAGEEIVDHEEVVQASDETEAVELSLEGEAFKDRDPSWEKGFTVDRVYRFTFSEVYEIGWMGRGLVPVDVPPFTGTFEEMDKYLAEQTKGLNLDARCDGFVPTYHESEPLESDLAEYQTRKG